MAIKISDMPEVVEIQGNEKIPVSQSDDSPGRLNPDGLKSFVLEKMKDGDVAVSIQGADKVFAKVGGEFKQVLLSMITSLVVNWIWDRSEVAEPGDATLLTVKAGETEKTLTLEGLASYVLAKNKVKGLKLDSLDDAGALVAEDLLLVNQSDNPVKATIEAVYTAIYEGLAAFIGDLDDIDAPAEEDIIPLVRGGENKKMTIEKLFEYVGAPLTGSGTTTANVIAEWDGVKALKAGRIVVQNINNPTHNAVPTAAAVAEAIEEAEAGSFTEGNWDIVLSGATTEGTCTYTSRFGFFSQKGRIAQLIGSVKWTEHNGDGVLRMNLPELPKNMQFVSGAVFSSGLGTTQLVAVEDGNFITFAPGAVASGEPVPVEIAADGTIRFSFVMLVEE